MNLGNILLSDISQAQKDTHCVTPCKVPREVELVETESKRQVTRARGTGNGKLMINGDRVLVWEDEKVLELDGGDNRTTT